MTRDVDAFMNELTNETRGRRGRRQRPAPQVPDPEPVLRKGDIIAGSAAAGFGVLVGWAGQGDLMRAQIAGVLNACQLPASWLPSAKSAHAHAGDAVSKLSSKGHVPRYDRKKKGDTRAFKARWVVAEVGHDTIERVGDKFGNTALIVTLWEDPDGPRLEIEGDRDLGDRVRNEYDRTIGEEVYHAGEITEWLRNLLFSRFGAVRLGGNWFIPKKYAKEAEALCTTLSEIWGVDWMLPAIPIASTSQVRAGIAKGLAREVEELIKDLEQRRESRQRKGRGDIGPRAAGSFVLKLKDIADRTRAYGDVLGKKYVKQVKETADALLAELEEICDDTAQRGALIWEEIAREAKK